MSYFVKKKSILNKKEIQINPIWIEDEDELSKYFDFLKSCNSLAVYIQTSLNKFTKQINNIIIGNSSTQLIINAQKNFPDALIPIFKSKTIKKIFFDCEVPINLINKKIGGTTHNIHDVSKNYSFFKNTSEKYKTISVIEAFYGKVLYRTNLRGIKSKPNINTVLKNSAKRIAYLIPINEYLESLISKINVDYYKRYSKSLELIRGQSNTLVQLYNKVAMTQYFDTELDKLIAINLHNYRMIIAKKQNKPCYFIINNKIFTKLVKEKPKNDEEVRKIFGQTTKNENLIHTVAILIAKTTKTYSKNILLYYYQITFYHQAFTILNKKNFDILSNKDFQLACLGDRQYIGINYRISKLKHWRKITANSIGIQPELLLSTLTLKHLCLRYPDKRAMNKVKGINNTFWDKYHLEIEFWLDQFEVRIYK